MDINEAQIYVGTYAKYNDGSLYGKWMELSDYSDLDEFLTVCKELHKDEEDPELMYQDWENISESLIGECSLSANFFSLRDAMESLTEEEQEAFFVWCNNGSHDVASEDADSLLSKFREEYCGKYDSEEDYTNEYVETCYELSEFSKTYFDYKRFADDLFSTDYWYEDGYVFRK